MKNRCLHALRKIAATVDSAPWMYGGSFNNSPAAPAPISTEMPTIEEVRKTDPNWIANYDSGKTYYDWGREIGVDAHPAAWIGHKALSTFAPNSATPRNTAFSHIDGVTNRTAYADAHAWDNYRTQDYNRRAQAQRNYQQALQERDDFYTGNNGFKNFQQHAKQQPWLSRLTEDQQRQYYDEVIKPNYLLKDYLSPEDWQNTMNTAHTGFKEYVESNPPVNQYTEQSNNNSLPVGTNSNKTKKRDAASETTEKESVSTLKPAPPATYQQYHDDWDKFGLRSPQNNGQHPVSFKDYKSIREQMPVATNMPAGASRINNDVYNKAGNKIGVIGVDGKFQQQQQQRKQGIPKVRGSYWMGNTHYDSKDRIIGQRDSAGNYIANSTGVNIKPNDPFNMNNLNKTQIADLQKKRQPIA